MTFEPPGVVEAAVRLAPELMTLPLRASGLDDEGVARFEEEILASGALPGALGWYRAAPLDAFTRTPPVRVPTTHCGAKARGGQQAGDQADRKVVEAPYELVTIEGVNHWAPTQAPDEVAEAVLARMA